MSMSCLFYQAWVAPCRHCPCGQRLCTFLLADFLSVLGLPMIYYPDSVAVAAAEAKHFRRGVVQPTMYQSLSHAARQLDIPERHEPLLCQLNGIKDPKLDLRLSHRREFLLLPPEDIVRSESCYCLMRKGKSLREVLERQQIQVEQNSWMMGLPGGFWAEVLKANPWADPKLGGIGLDGRLVHDLQYVRMPDSAKCGTSSVPRMSALAPMRSNGSC